MISKRIQLEFADPKIRAIDHINDIRKAAENAGLNLFAKYNVRLQYPMPTENDRVVVEIKIPETIAKTFSIGNHLRGISSYLLTQLEFGYKDFLVGNRLLNYIELPDSNQKQEGLSLAERLEAVASFAKLLERSDEEALSAISQILIILKDNG